MKFDVEGKQWPAQRTKITHKQRTFEADLRGLYSHTDIPSKLQTLGFGQYQLAVPGNSPNWVIAYLEQSNNLMLI